MDKQKIFSNLNLFKGDSNTICEEHQFGLMEILLNMLDHLQSLQIHRIILKELI